MPAEPADAFPAPVPPGHGTGSLTDDLLSRLRTEPRAVALRHLRRGDWVDVSVTAFHRQVTSVAAGLVAAGLEHGDRVALVSRTRYEWTVLDYACWWSGLVVVPVYDSASADTLVHVLADSGAVAALVETPDHAATLASLRDRLPDLRQVWTIDADPGAFDILIEQGTDVGDEALEARRSSVGPGDAATLIYTSGTTGHPKGCRLTHANLHAEIDGALDRLADVFAAEDASTLLFLPLPHVLARIVQVGAIRSGAVLGHTSDVAHLEEHLRSFGPTFVLSVPRVFEQVFNRISAQAWADGDGPRFERAVKAAIAYSRGLGGDDASGRPGLATRARHRLYDRSAHQRVRDALGGQLRWAASGGAPLGERLAHFYRGVGITVLEGYGLTETSAALCSNTPGEQRIGSVGRLFPGVELQVAADGELLVRGPQVFDGYWRDESATDAVLDPDGWFATGDLGEIDDDGFVWVSGRKQEVIVTAGGKNVTPTVLEDRVRAHSYVSHCLVVGDGKPYVAALITVDRDAWSGRLDDPELRQELQRAVDDANAHVSQAEAIRRFVVVEEDWTEENGYLTPSFKVRRSAVLRDLHDTVEAMFVR